MRRMFATLAAALVAGSALAQPYPSKPLRVIVPWPPGQATDLSARLVAQKVSESIGQPIVADNRPGAGGIIGTEAAAKSAPDGYTLLAGSSGPLSINPLLQKTPYDPEKSFAPVSLIATVPYVLVTAPNFPASSARELIALVRANPGKYTFASSGTGATTHLITEVFNSRAGLQATHVPYKGSGPSLTDVMGGQVAYTIETMAAVVSNVRAGRLKALAITSAERNPALPDVPTVAEAADMPGFNMIAWIGYLAPAGTPREIVNRLSGEVQKALASPDVRERYGTLGLNPTSMTPDDLAKLMRDESVRYADIIKRANIKLE
jgi:tripartite-type tricarboxylate transporter receptor subunit TctC